jgi:GNAT superfamily N-acetyltransferase
LRQARRIYKTCLPEEERVPWRWIKEGLAGERVWHPDRWSCHLLLAGLRRPGEEKRRVIGFAYGAHVPGFGGYGGYLGVDPRYRGRGVGARLWRLLIQRLQLDAACAGVPLPFVVWESRPPAQEAAEEEHTVWRSRLRLWAQVGAWRVGGVRFLTPNFADRHGPPVPLQLFLKPVDLPPAAFDATALRSVVAGLHRFVYELPSDDDLAITTLPTDARPTLQALVVRERGPAIRERDP